MASTFARQTGRLDRHVRRSVLRVSEGVSRHRIAYSIEEALRLAILPGEEEGRIYCLRRVSLSGIPAEANRRAWMEQVQQVLGALAAEAVHASNPSAASANAVYFNNIEEALETLLRKAVRATGGTRWNTPEWFANSALGVEPGTSYAAQIPAIVERLRPPSMAPGAAAAILFAALGDADPAPLLTAIPIASIREWLRELDSPTSLFASTPPLQLPGEVKTALQRAASHFGWKDPPTVWLAAQAVLKLLPGGWISGTVVKRARATLRILENEQLREPQNRTAKLHDPSTSQFVFDDDESGAPQQRSLGDGSTNPAPHDEVKFPRMSAPVIEVHSPEQASTLNESAAVTAPLAVKPPELLTAKQPIMGEATQAAGLFFLINVLHSLGIVRALEASPALAESNLAVHVLRQLAAEADVPEDDPILLCLSPQQPEFALPEEIIANLPSQSEVWPKGLFASRRAGFDSDCFLRVWILATRRWLWRMGRLTLRQVVNRDGRVWRTRTDIDVTFPLAAADLRIRRIGLDIDPGWLPWFGEWGRVVRFHYRDREPEGPA